MPSVGSAQVLRSATDADLRMTRAFPALSRINRGNLASSNLLSAFFPLLYNPR